MAGIPRMRTIQQCAAYLKERDPGTSVGEWCIRQMVNRGEIPVVRSGRRILINLDMLMAYLAGDGPAPEPESKEAAEIVTLQNNKKVLS